MIVDYKNDKNAPTGGFEQIFSISHKENNVPEKDSGYNSGNRSSSVESDDSSPEDIGESEAYDHEKSVTPSESDEDDLAHNN